MPRSMGLTEGPGISRGGGGGERGGFGAGRGGRMCLLLRLDRLNPDAKMRDSLGGRRAWIA